MNKEYQMQGLDLEVKQEIWQRYFLQKIKMGTGCLETLNNLETRKNTLNVILIVNKLSDINNNWE